MTNRGMNRSTRVAHLVLSLEMGGLEMLVANMARFQYQNGCKVVVICLDVKGVLAQSLIDLGIEVVCVERRPGKLDVQALKSVRDVLKQRDINIIHSHNVEAQLYAVLAKGFSTIPVIHEQHGHVTQGLLSKPLVLKLLGSRLSYFVGVSESVGDYAKSVGWVSDSKLRVIINGVDTDSFLPKENLKEQSEFTVICVARLAEVKDHATLIKGFSKFVSQRKSAKLWVVGDGPLETDLKKLAGDLGVKDYIDFLGERHDIPDLLEKADVFCMTSLSEGVSVSLLEAMSSGTPAIVTSVGGNVQIIENEKNGLLIETKDDGALVSGLVSLFDDSERLQGFAREARKTVIERYSFSKMMDGYMTLYDNALRGCA